MSLMAYPREVFVARRMARRCPFRLTALELGGGQPSTKSEAIARSPRDHLAMTPKVDKCCEGATDLVANVEASRGAPCYVVDRMLSEAQVQGLPCWACKKPLAYV